jgi:hypothetical protein
MTADDNMLYLQMSDRKNQHSKYIRIYDEVSYAAMNKDLTWLRPVISLAVRLSLQPIHRNSGACNETIFKIFGIS